MDYMERVVITAILAACTTCAVFIIGLKLVRHFGGA